MTLDTRVSKIWNKTQLTAADNCLNNDILLFLVVPTEGKATADYMEGLFDLDLDDVQLNSSSTTKTNISPSMLKKRIEVLQHEDKR